jgi:hypothetical protein
VKLFVFDSNKLNKAFRSHDSAKVVAALEADGLREPVLARKFVTALRQSSCLALQIEDAAKEARRDQLVGKCRELLTQCSDATIAQDFEDHVADAKIVERGYRELFQTMRKSEIWKRTLAEQIWGMILRAERESAHVKKEIEKKIAKLAAEKHPLGDPRQLKLEDRSRLFKARFQLREQDFSIKEGGTRHCTVLEVQSATDRELMDHIALARLEQVFFQSQMGLKFSGVDEKISDTSTTGPVPLAKAGYFSKEERVSVEILEGNYCVPVDDNFTVIAGLPFKAWIRGYAYYAKKAEDPSGNPILSCLRLSAKELADGLLAAGLSNEQAKIFVELTTFGQGAADLFDAPLLKVNDGSYCFFAPAYQAPTLGVIALSRISSLNRRRDQQGEPANDCLFEDKGKLFEGRVLNFFAEAKIAAHGFKYNLDGTDYDCDVATIIGDALFIFECKNRSLPMGHLPSLYYFTLALDEAQEQVRRIARQFAEHPEIVRGHFGANAKWNRIVPVVLHALPWSFGCPDGVYIYDASALSHLLLKGFTSIGVVSRIDENHFMRRHRYPLKKGEIPTADELEREMRNPNQLRLHALGWKQIAQPIPASDNFVFSLPEWTQQASTLEEQMIALGSSPEEAATKAKELTEEFPESVEKLRDGIQNRNAKIKVGRNDPCPCGSGKKFKKCCLK